MRETNTPRIAVIGAGMTGLRCAAELRAAGHAPVVLDKGRGLGGRMATRRTEWGTFDHGARFVEPVSAAFGAFMAGLVDAGAAAPWGALGRFVGMPGMSGLVAPLAEGLAVQRGVEIGRIDTGADGVTLAGAAGEIGVFDRVVVAIPAPQAMALLPVLRERIAAAEMAPCYAALMAFEAPLDLADAPALADPALGWAGRNGAKPGRSGETWVVQASADWSRAHLELDRPEAAQALLARFRAAVPCAVPDPVYLAGHRWRYALTERALGVACLSEGPIHVAGDWCLGPTVEAAWQSGGAVARAVLESL